VAGLLEATRGDHDGDQAEQEERNADQRSEPRASRSSEVERESERVQERRESHDGADARVFMFRQGDVGDDDAQGQNLQNEPGGDE
jgi:hypothetical protein